MEAGESRSCNVIITGWTYRPAPAHGTLPAMKVQISCHNYYCMQILLHLKAGIFLGSKRFRSNREGLLATPFVSMFWLRRVWRSISIHIRYFYFLSEIFLSWVGRTVLVKYEKKDMKSQNYNLNQKDLFKIYRKNANNDVKVIVIIMFREELRPRGPSVCSPPRWSRSRASPGSCSRPRSAPSAPSSRWPACSSARWGRCQLSSQRQSWPEWNNIIWEYLELLDFSHLHL